MSEIDANRCDSWLTGPDAFVGSAGCRQPAVDDDPVMTQTGDGHFPPPPRPRGLHATAVADTASGHTLTLPLPQCHGPRLPDSTRPTWTPQAKISRPLFAPKQTRRRPAPAGRLRCAFLLPAKIFFRTLYPAAVARARTALPCGPQPRDRPGPGGRRQVARIPRGARRDHPPKTSPSARAYTAVSEPVSRQRQPAVPGAVHAERPPMAGPGHSMSVPPPPEAYKFLAAPSLAAHFLRRLLLVLNPRARRRMPPWTAPAPPPPPRCCWSPSSRTRTCRRCCSSWRPRAPPSCPWTSWCRRRRPSRRARWRRCCRARSCRPSCPRRTTWWASRRWTGSSPGARPGTASSSGTPPPSRATCCRTTSSTTISPASSGSSTPMCVHKLFRSSLSSFLPFPSLPFPPLTKHTRFVALLLECSASAHAHAAPPCSVVDHLGLDVPKLDSCCRVDYCLWRYCCPSICFSFGCCCWCCIVWIMYKLPCKMECVLCSCFLAWAEPRHVTRIETGRTKI